MNKRVFSIGLALALSLTAGAQSSRTATVMTSVSPAEVARMLSGAGIASRVNNDTPPSLSFTTGTNTTQLYFLDCASGRCSTMTLSTGFDLDRAPTLASINAWNRDHSFTFAYLDEENDPFLQYDLDLDGGVTSAAIVAWVKLYRGSLADFVKTFKLR